MNSIRRKLLIYIFFLILFGTAIVSILTLLSAHQEINEVFDGNMKQVAKALSTHNSIDKLNYDLLNKDNIKGEEEFLIQYWREDTLIYSSHPVINFPLHDTQDFSDIKFENEKWRIYQIVKGNVIYQVSQSLKERNELIFEIGLNFIIPILLQLPILIFLSYLLIGKGLEPLNEISKRVENLDENALKSIDLIDTPKEITPLVSALNSLFERLKKALLIQQQFTADAAHELRTPLTALSLQLDLLKRAENNMEQEDAALNLRKGVDRATHLVKNLLLLARQEPNTNTKNFENVNFSEIINKIITSSLPLVKSKNQNLIYNNVEEKIFVNGEKENLETLVENIIQNALLYTPDNGVIEIMLKKSNDKIIFSVSDNGIGIPKDERTRVFDRFYRVVGTNKSGSGLGLAIVKTIIENHNATITIGDGQNGTGTKVEAIFPS